jgi:hypothetical protein
LNKLKTTIGERSQPENDEGDEGGQPNVFKRLAMPRSRTYKDDKKKKGITKEKQVNFFDAHYRQPIISINLQCISLTKSPY